MAPPPFPRMAEDSMRRKRRIDLGGGDAVNAPSQQQQQRTSSSALNPWTGYPYTSRYYSILETRQKLPVYQFKDELVDAVTKNQFVVVEGETGSGASFLCGNDLICLSLLFINYLMPAKTILGAFLLHSHRQNDADSAIPSRSRLGDPRFHRRGLYAASSCGRHEHCSARGGRNGRDAG